MKHLFIINPVAGRVPVDERKKIIGDVVDHLPESVKRDAVFEVYVTTGPMDAMMRTKSEGERGGDLRVYAFGGDGTLNECVNGAVGLPNVAVTHYPCGTGNDFVKTFGPDKTRFKDLRDLICGEVRPIDVIDCNGRYSVNICSVGLDAKVGTDVHKYTGLPLAHGKGAYVVSLAVHYLKGLGVRMNVSAGGLTAGPELNMVCCCNGRFYGGRFNPTNEARPDDGLMDCLIVSGVTRLNFAGIILGFARGKFRKHPEHITCVRTDEVVIDTRDTEVINLDGEKGYGRHIVMKLIPNGLNFIFPRGMTFWDKDPAR